MQGIPSFRRKRALRRGLARRAWFLIVLTLLLGVLMGVGAFTFGYGRGWSYLSHDPAACINCHVMQDHYDSWMASSHRRVAVCNDCHLPHDFVGKWAVKGENGFFHSLAFTLQNFKEPIQIKPRNRKVTQAACLHCHADLVQDMTAGDPHAEAPSCVHCHTDVGHAFRRRTELQRPDSLPWE
jgi:cytochrome c nitrite reductase small subunit